MDRLDLPPGSLDAVTSVDTLYFATDQTKTVTDLAAARTAYAAGALILQAPSPSWLSYPVRQRRITVRRAAVNVPARIWYRYTPLATSAPAALRPFQKAALPSAA